LFAIEEVCARACAGSIGADALSEAALFVGGAWSAVRLLGQALTIHENFGGSAGCAFGHLGHSHSQAARTFSHDARSSFVASTLLVIFAHFTVVGHFEAGVVDHDFASHAGHASLAVPDSSGHTCAGHCGSQCAIAEAALFFSFAGGAKGHFGVADSSHEHIGVRITFYALRFPIRHGSGWAKTGE
jgi:hypothetical protein